MGVHETKTFKSGNSEAVRIPKGMGFGIGVDVRVEQTGDSVTLRRAVDLAEGKRLWLKMFDDLAALPKAPRMKREPIAVPDRWS